MQRITLEHFSSLPADSNAHVMYAESFYRKQTKKNFFLTNYLSLLSNSIRVQPVSCPTSDVHAPSILNSISFYRFPQYISHINAFAGLWHILKFYKSIYTNTCRHSHTYIYTHGLTLEGHSTRRKIIFRAIGDSNKVLYVRVLCITCTFGMHTGGPRISDRIKYILYYT